MPVTTRILNPLVATARSERPGHGRRSPLPSGPLPMHHPLSALRSLGTARPYRSAGRAFLRRIYPLSAEPFLARLPQAGLAELTARYGPGGTVPAALRVDGTPAQWPKYLDAPRWLRLNLRRVHDLGLHRGRPGLRILDLGSGAGYFLFLCRELGHQGVGMDVPEPAFYGEMFSLLGLRRVVAPVRPRVPLPPELVPADGGRFDLVTAFSIAFNGHLSPAPWGPAEWDLLLADLRTRFLTPGGRVYLDLNPEPPDGAFMPPTLRAFFQARGAVVDRSKVDFRPLRPGPAAVIARPFMI